MDQCSLSPMTLDEAIEHCQENYDRLIKSGCEKCANEHHQLAMWLIELKELRKEKCLRK